MAIKPTGQMNTLGCHRVAVTDKGKSALTHIFTADTTTDALWLYTQLTNSGLYAKVRLMDSSGHQWVVGLRVDARLMKEDEKPAVVFEDPELERIHNQHYLEH